MGTAAIISPFRTSPTFYPSHSVIRLTTKAAKKMELHGILIVLLGVVGLCASTPVDPCVTKSGTNLNNLFEVFAANGVIGRVELAGLTDMGEVDGDVTNITEAEFLAAWVNMAEVQGFDSSKGKLFFDKIDNMITKDGKIDAAEKEALFKHFDADSSGGVSAAEFCAVIMKALE